jgi:hypothetical protein
MTEDLCPNCGEFVYPSMLHFWCLLPDGRVRWACVKKERKDADD